MSDYGSEPYLSDREKTLNIQISDSTFEIETLQESEAINCTSGRMSTKIDLEIQKQEETIDSLRERLKDEAEKRVESEIAYNMLYRQCEKMRSLLALSDDPTKANQEISDLNSIRLGMIPVSNAISTETQQKTTEFFIKSLILEMAKDITKLGLFYDAIVHMGTLSKIELNKVDHKAKTKIKFEAQVASVEKVRTSPAPKPGRRKLSPNESILKTYYDLFKRANGKISQDELFNSVKPLMVSPGGLSEIQLATLITEYFKTL